MSDAPQVEVEAAEPAAGGELARIASLVARLKILEAARASAELALAAAKEAVRVCEEVDLVQAMVAAGQSKLTLLDKTKLELKTALIAGITEEQKPRAFEYLAANGAEDFVKHKITAELPRGADESAKLLLDFIRTLPVANAVKIDDRESVNVQTLSAWVRARAAKGLPLPTEVMSVHVRTFVDVKRKKLKEDDEV